MKGKNSRNIIPKFLILLALASLFPLCLFIFSPKNLTKEQSFKLLTKEVDQLSDKLLERWRLGDIEGLYGSSKFKCLGVKNKEILDSSFFECNPYYLRCFLGNGDKHNKLIGVNSYFRTKSFKFFLQSQEHFKISENGKVRLTLSTDTGEEVYLELENSCRDVYLPKKVYSAGPRGVDKRWDNYAQNIFIDKNYVSNFDIYLWNKYRNGSLNLKTKDFNNSKKWELPSIELSLGERKSFCKSLGGEITKSRIFDAAAFYPSSSENNYVYKYDYPWGRARGRKSQKASSDLCEKAYVSGCEKHKALLANSDVGVSWIGIRHALGSYMEVFENQFDERANLKVSNGKIPFSHFWNKNGRRAFWSGSLSSKDSFVLKEQYSGEAHKVDFNGVGFRCTYIK